MGVAPRKDKRGEACKPPATIARAKQGREKSLVRGVNSGRLVPRGRRDYRCDGRTVAVVARRSAALFDRLQGHGGTVDTETLQVVEHDPFPERGSSDARGPAHRERAPMAVLNSCARSGPLVDGSSGGVG